MKTNWGTGINMTPLTRCSTILVLLVCAAFPAWGQQYLLYSPQPVETAQKKPSQDGVVVQEIEVQKGDTLFGLSRKFNGHGMYYPQILLFNSIKDPNLIYPGKNLKIPVSPNETRSEPPEIKPDAMHKIKATPDKQSAVKKETPSSVVATVPSSTSSTELSLSDLKSVGAGKPKTTNRQQKKAAVQAKKKPTQEKTAVAPLPPAHKSSSIASGQKTFEAAVKAYKHDDCRTALELLDRYLADNSGSPLAADANLYKAECYLKMSAK
jgi:hypothetical protein